ncbi:MAG TPA: DUF1638 domain-containing protein [Anaerovoracaceae bacterium]|nr:DUF1638 domain-containing protein [Anaerovoracaceae bacterium]
MDTTLIIACNTIADELNSLIKETGCSYPVLWIQSGLHNSTEILRGRLQKELDHLSNADQVLLAFGYCGNSLVGLTPPSYKMIFPRVDDCISLLLGSTRMRKKIEGETGTYFLTKGWLEHESNIWYEYQETVKRRGKEKTDQLYKMLLKNYGRLGIIDTGAYDPESISETTHTIAQTLNLKHEVFPGTLDYLKKLLTGPWDEDFITIDPGETVTLTHIYGF